MARPGEKITVSIDAEMVEQARAAFGSEDTTDAAVIERALNALLLERLLDTTRARSSLSYEDAERLAYDELHASRRERGAA
jgi:hypothetical protein